MPPFYPSLTGGSPNISKVMEFIDGGYLRKEMEDLTGSDRINFGALQTQLLQFPYMNASEPIRTYYYDAIVEMTPETNEKWKEQNDYFEKIKDTELYEVRLGREIKDGTGTYKQKGVDVLLATDMLTKAYESHYDVAVLVAGDDDLVDLVRAVKEAGKRVYGAFFRRNCSKRLRDSFDRRLYLDNFLQSLVFKP